MGSGKSASVEKAVTPAVARSISSDNTSEAQQAQAEERARRRGISSTYNRFASADSSSANGSKEKLG